MGCRFLTPSCTLLYHHITGAGTPLLKRDILGDTPEHWCQACPNIEGAEICVHAMWGAGFSQPRRAHCPIVTKAGTSFHENEMCLIKKGKTEHSCRGYTGASPMIIKRRWIHGRDLLDPSYTLSYHHISTRATWLLYRINMSQTIRVSCIRALINMSNDNTLSRAERMYFRNFVVGKERNVFWSRKLPLPEEWTRGKIRNELCFSRRHSPHPHASCFMI